MSTDSLSPTAPSYDDVIARIGLRADLPPRRRQDLASAVRRFCRIEGHSPPDVVVDPDDLRRRLSQMSPRTSGLSRGGLRNLKSLLGKALIEAGIASVRRRSRTRLPPEWQQFLGGIQHRDYRYRLSHFARYCVERGRLPADVDDELMSAYGRDLVSQSLLERPKQMHRTACLAFNEGIDASAGPPMRKLRVP